MDCHSLYEPLTLVEDLVEEDLMDCDDNSDTECNYNAEQSEREVKVEVMISDSCLLCGHSPAVSYDSEGKPIKKEPYQLDYSYQHLFSSLCHVLAIRKSCRIWAKWNFDKEPFPFCEKCESLMTSLAELRHQLDKVESSIKEAMRGSEGKYVEENLYERHHHRYYEFRKVALGEHFLGTEVKGVGVRRTKSLSKWDKHKPICSQISQTEDDFVNPLAMPTLPTMLTPMKQPAEPQGIQMMKGKSKTKKSLLKIRRQKKKSIKTKRVTPSEDALTPTTDEFKEMPSTKTKVTTGSGLRSLGMESISKLSSKIRVAKCKRISDRKHSKPSSADVERAREEKKAKWKQKERQSYEDKYSTLLRFSKMSRSEMTPKEKALFSRYPIVRDPDTHEITLFTGSGNRYMNKRVILKFTKVEEKEKIFKYECTSCSEIVTLKRATSRNSLMVDLIRAFRAHYRRLHMKVYRLCPKDSDSTCFINKPDLLVHLKSAHKVNSILQMNLKTWGSNIPKVGCHICAMPFDKRNAIQFNLHLKTHMSEEERQSFVIAKGKGRVDLPVLKDESLCETCGKTVGGERFGMNRHKKGHLNDSNIMKRACLCSLCGDTLSNKYALAGHMKRVHPDGKSVVPSCKFPTCEGMSFDTELRLKEHVAEEHLDSYYM